MFRLDETAVLVTRPSGEGTALCERIEALGGVAVHQPGIELRPALASEPTLRHLNRLTKADTLIFTSPAAVRHARSLLAGRVPAGAAAWGVGGRTAADLRQVGLDNVQAPEAGHGSEALLAEPAFAKPRGRRILILGARDGRSSLHRSLTERGARVEPVYVYRRRPPRLRRGALERLREHFARSIVTATSVEIVTNVTALYRGRLPASLTRRPLAVISKRIAAAARELGYGRIAVSDGPATEDILQAVAELAGAW